MLRTTITKNRKACILAFLPRVLKGDLRYAPNKYQRLCVNAQSILEKSTNPGSNNHDDICEKCRRLIELSFGSNNETTNQGIPKQDTRNILNHAQNLNQKYNMNRNLSPYVDAKDEAQRAKRRDDDGLPKPDHREIQSLTDGEKLERNIEHGDEKSIGIKKPYNDDFHEAPKVFPNAIKERFVTNFDDKPSREPTPDTGNYVESSNESGHYWKYSYHPVINAHLGNSNSNKRLCKDRTILPSENMRVRATKAKQAEEKLTQKLERIDEIPLVEAPNTNVEGFNVHPKVLGETEPKTKVYSHNDFTTRKSGSKESDEPLLDDLAKRCLNAPRNEIDDRLLKEMEKLGVPQAGHKSSDTPLMDDELIQMDVLKKPKRPVRKTDIDLESREYEKDLPDSVDVKNLYPTYAIETQKQFQVDRRRKNRSRRRSHINQFKNRSLDNINENTQEEESTLNKLVRQVEAKPNVSPKTLPIDPYSKKITEDDDYANPNNLSPQLNSAITQAMPYVPVNTVGHKREHNTSSVSRSTRKTRRHKEPVDPTSNNGSTQFAFKILNMTHKQHNSAESKHMVDPTQTINSSLEAPKRMVIEPLLHNYGHCLTEDFPKRYTREKSGEQMAHHFSQQSDKRKLPSSTKSTTKEAFRTASTPGELPRFESSPLLQGQFFTSKTEPFDHNTQEFDPQRISNEPLSPIKRPEQVVNLRLNEQIVKVPDRTTAGSPRHIPIEPQRSHFDHLTSKPDLSNRNEQVNYQPLANHVSEPEVTPDPQFSEETIKVAETATTTPRETHTIDPTAPQKHTKYATSKPEQVDHNNQDYPLYNHHENTIEGQSHNFAQPQQTHNPQFSGLVHTASTPGEPQRYDPMGPSVLHGEYHTSKPESEHSHQQYYPQANTYQQTYGYVQSDQIAHPQSEAMVNTANTPAEPQRFDPMKQSGEYNIPTTQQSECNDHIYSSQGNSNEHNYMQPEQNDNPQINEQALKGAVSATATSVESPTIDPSELRQMREQYLSPERNSQANSYQQATEAAEAEQMATPLIKETPKQAASESFTKNVASLPLPNLNLDRNLSLTELLRRVRYRNHMEFCSSYRFSARMPQVDPVVGKCGPKKPPCPPPAPCCPPPPPPPPRECPPPPPKCPKPCKPKCPAPCAPPPKQDPCPKPPKCDPCAKPSKCDPCAKFERSSFGTNIKALLTLIFTPSLNRIKYAAMLFNFRLPSERTCNAVLTDDVIESLQTVGKTLLSVQNEAKIQSLKSEMAHEGREGMSYARDFDPWTPIPSWPVEKKEEKKPFICPKEGCKQIPPPRRDHPCHEKPCTTFPKRIFSPINLLSAFADENKLYDH